jgi:hypothetical protein
MTNRDSDALCLPARPPQHAAPVSFRRRRGLPGRPGVFGRLRRLTCQVLQLFITFVAWAAGLSLVIGSVVLVVTVTEPRQAAPAIKVSRQDDPLRQVQDGERPTSGDAARSPYHQVLVAFSGHGSRTTARFNVKTRLRWQLQWTYHCGAGADGGHFKLLRADLGPGQEPVTTTDEFATSGHGLVWLTPTGPRHYLVVQSACSWHIEVLQAAT